MTAVEKLRAQAVVSANAIRNIACVLEGHVVTPEHLADMREALRGHAKELIDAAIATRGEIK